MQKLIVETDVDEFERKINILLEEEWKVIPGSLTTNVSSNTVDNGFGDVTEASYICSVVLEK